MSEEDRKVHLFACSSGAFPIEEVESVMPIEEEGIDIEDVGYIVKFRHPLCGDHTCLCITSGDYAEMRAFMKKHLEA